MAVCPYCGAANADGVKFCAECGAPIAEGLSTAAAAVPEIPEIPAPAPEAPISAPQPAEAAPQPTFDTPQPVYTPPQSPVAQPQPVYTQQQAGFTPTQSVTPYPIGGLIAWAVVTMLLCLIPGIIALVNVININKSVTPEEQQQRISRAKTWCIVATVLGVLNLISGIGTANRFFQTY